MNAPPLQAWNMRVKIKTAFANSHTHGHDAPVVVTFLTSVPKTMQAAWLLCMFVVNSAALFKLLPHYKAEELSVVTH